MNLQRIDEIVQIKNAVNDVRDLGKREERYTSNFFVSDEKLLNWIGKQQLFLIVSDDKKLCLIVRKRKKYLKDDQFFYHVYFVKRDTEENFKKFLEDCRKNFLIDAEIVLDLFGSEKQNAPLIQFFESLGFENYCSLTRISNLGAAMKDEPLDEIVSDEMLAKPGDEIEILDIIHENMDELAEQIPDKDEILHAIEHQIVLVVRDENKKIITFWWGDWQGKTTVIWRYWATRKSHRKDGGLGLQLLPAMLSKMKNAKRQLGWVRDDNIFAQEIYKFLGFSLDDMHDVVMLSKFFKKN